jgi:hypothetical protein
VSTFWRATSAQTDSFVWPLSAVKRRRTNRATPPMAVSQRAVTQATVWRVYRPMKIALSITTPMALPTRRSVKAQKTLKARPII